MFDISPVNGLWSSKKQSWSINISPLCGFSRQNPKGGEQRRFFNLTYFRASLSPRQNPIPQLLRCSAALVR